MQLTGIYKFTQWPDNEYTNPTITSIPRSQITMDETELLINAGVYMEGAGYKIRVQLDEIIVENFDYNPDELLDRVVTRLQDFKV